MNVQESRNKQEQRPLNDFYETPKCITWELLNNYLLDNVSKDKVIYDPCCGKYAIGNELRKYGYTNIVEQDIIYGNDFLKYNGANYDAIIINPPFKDFDAFVKKAKEQSEIVCSIGRLNFFGAHKRNIDGLWNNLKYVLIFDRQIAYDRPFREDGKVECGMLISCWFIWEKSYTGQPIIKLIDTQKYIIKKEKGNA